MSVATHSRLTAWATRLETLGRTLGRNVPPVREERDVASALDAIVDVQDRSQVWLALAVMAARFPDEETVLETARVAEFVPGGLFAAVQEQTDPAALDWTLEVVSDRILIDVADTATTTMATGIQRVVREVAKRWVVNPSVRFIAWAGTWDAMRDLERAEFERVREGTARIGDDPVGTRRRLVIPWETSYVLLEVSAEPARAARLRAMARFGRVRCTAITYDLIPVTSSETSAPGMTGVFSHYMSALKYFARLCTISAATAYEYEGWRVMLGGAGLTGPDVRPVLLPAAIGDVDDDAIASARDRLLVSNMPLVLVVGSHEPRKNHIAVLHAAEVLWREGHRFSLSFIGGNSWKSEEFRARLSDLQGAGRPVESISRAGDDLLWAAYRLARFTVFPSLNEGFGLPVAESLAVGTPVITSAFGSTREIADGGGALLVDPRDDTAITDAIRSLLIDEGELQRLRTEAASRPPRTWDDYAIEVWDCLMAGDVSHRVARQPGSTLATDAD